MLRHDYFPWQHGASWKSKETVVTESLIYKDMLYLQRDVRSVREDRREAQCFFSKQC